MANNRKHVFRVEINTNCKVCNEKITEPRFRTYCSAKCRNKAMSIKYKDKQAEYQRIRKDKIASIPNPKKIQCKICSKWYVQVCTHTVQKHGLTGREYRKMFGLDVKLGKSTIPEWYRKIKSEQVTNVAINNLQKGKKYWFKPGDERAGRYVRSEETMKRLKKLNQLTTRWEVQHK